MEDNKNKCEECEMTFYSKGHLKHHISNIHLKEKPHKCEYCDFATSQKYALQLHSCYSRKKSNPNNKEITAKTVEAHIHNKLKNELNAAHEIICPFGRIDLMTADTIIEIKNWNDHKKGMGQILGYASFFPSYKKRIHFFGTRPINKILEAIREVCRFYNVEITEEDY